MVVSQDAWTYFNFLVSIETCFETEYVVNFDKSFLRDWDEVILFCIWVKCSANTRSIWFIKSIIASISLVSFCHNNLSVHNSGILKYFTTNMSWSVCDLKCGYSFVWAIAVKNQNFILVEFYLNEYEVPFPICLDKFGLKLILLGKKLGIPACFLGLFS